MWSFEGGVADPWSVMSDPTQGYNANSASVQSSTAQASSGSRSLKVSFTNANYAEVGTQLCSGGFDLYNYTLNFDFYSDAYTGWVVPMAWNGTPASGQWSSSSNVYLTAGQWQTFHATFGTDNSTGARYNSTNIGINTAQDGNTISGTVYIDNIYLTH